MGQLLPFPVADCCRPSTCSTTSTTCPSGVCVGDGAGIYDTLADLKAAPASVFPTTTAKKEFIILGLNVIYDGGYRIYAADLSNSDPPDDYQTVEATNFTGRLKLLFG